jgi:hypothetical protein
MGGNLKNSLRAAKKVKERAEERSRKEMPTDALTGTRKYRKAAITSTKTPARAGPGISGPLNSLPSHYGIILGGR